jgi:hypothetical protein
LTFARLDQSDSDEEDIINTDDVTIEADVDHDIRLYRSFPVLKRIVHQEEDPETGLEHFEVSDPLKWWRDHAKSMPILSRLARQTLCVPASSASCERLFSSAGLTIASDRSRLTAENAADLVFLKGTWTTVDDAVNKAKRKAECAGLPDL